MNYLLLKIQKIGNEKIPALAGIFL